MNVAAKRILYVEGNVDRTIGGSYYSLLYLASGLDRGKYAPIVVFANANALIPRFNADGVRTIVRRVPSPLMLTGRIGRVVAKVFNFVIGFIIEPIRIASLLRYERISLLHLNNSITRNHPWMIGARLARIPCITHERGINKKFQRRARVLGSRLDAVICISDAVRDCLVTNGLGGLRLTTIHNGLDPAEMRVTCPAAEIRRTMGISPSCRLIGIVGNIKAWKGQEIVIQAMDTLREKFPHLVCLLIGDTSPEDPTYRRHILKLIAELGLESRVVITGFRTDVANCINALDIQIHASLNPEPFGRVLLEGMALRKPIVASYGGVVPEIVVSGVTGLLFAPGQPQMLAEQLETLLKDSTRSLAMGQAGYRRLVDEFSITHNISQTQMLYQRLLRS